MSLDKLPNEILCLLPFYIDNIETFTNAASSCRRLRDCLHTAHPNTILRLAAASAPTFFSPHPHFLVTATARQVSDWALGNETRTLELREAFQGGIDSLYEFCLQHAGLTLEDIRRTHLARFSTINPLSDKIDKMAGNQWFATPDFWDGGVSEPYTIQTEADRATFQMIIYGELFGRSMDAFLQPEKNLPYFDIQTRIDYFTYCLPDWVCSSYPGFTRLPTGPYAPHLERPSEGDQVALHHILHCGRWRRMWAAAIRSVLGGDDAFTDEDEEDEHWRKRMLRNALQSQGLEGMQLVTLPVDKIDKEYVQKVRRMKEQIDQLNEPPRVEMLGKGTLTPVSFAPDPPHDVEIPCRNMWGPWTFNPDAASGTDSEEESDPDWELNLEVIEQ
ncbi:hypothetical protein AARAC_002986 [Aspergillus arachidicola]|uniref:F-box domain-containing protein n=1 Tax=Aspergillus arachidicola TaxID=656916 RepID=A0A2G7FZ81_9EURO|nr:hypothetical protein AARAC_002986 [Aspergillus arachidicola]